MIAVALPQVEIDVTTTTQQQQQQKNWWLMKRCQPSVHTAVLHGEYEIV